MSITTFWLYDGKRVLTAVRLDEKATDKHVREVAIYNELNCPISHITGEETPYEFRNRLSRATVRVFPTTAERR